MSRRSYRIQQRTMAALHPLSSTSRAFTDLVEAISIAVAEEIDELENEHARLIDAIDRREGLG